MALGFDSHLLDGSVLAEQLRYILEALPEGVSFKRWYARGADIAELIGEPGYGDPVQSEAVSYALGYLRGAQHALDFATLPALFEAFKISTSKRRMA